MILLWFIVGIAIICCIARYNESNKLFWTLLFAYVMGFAGAKMYLDMHHGNEKQSIECSKKVYPTRTPAIVLDTFEYHITGNVADTPNVVTAHKSVGQGTTPAYTGTNITLSGVFGRVRDQPQLKLIKPPEPWLQNGFSTHHDTG